MVFVMWIWLWTFHDCGHVVTVLWTFHDDFGHFKRTARMLKKNIYHSCVQFIMVKNMLFVYLQFFTLSCGKIKSYQTSVGASVYLLVNYWSLGPVTVKNVAIIAEWEDDYQKHNACRRAWAVHFQQQRWASGRRVPLLHTTPRDEPGEGLSRGSSSAPHYPCLSTNSYPTSRQRA